MNFLNRLFDCCFRNKEDFKLYPNIDKKLEENENSEAIKEKEKSETIKEKEKSETIKEKENSETIKEKDTETTKEKENSETIDIIKEKKYSTTIKDKDKGKDKEKNNLDNILEKKYPTTIKEKEKDKDKEKNNSNNIKEKENSETIKDKDKNIKDTPKDKDDLTPIGSDAQNFSSFNATLQCLSNIKKLNEFFLVTFPKNQDYEEKIISYEYYKLIQKIVNENNNNKISYSSLIKFKEKLSDKYAFLSKKVESNSKDLFIFLLEELNSELKDKSDLFSKKNSFNQNYNEAFAFNEFSNELKAKHNSIICDLFPVVSEKIYQCNICKIQQYFFELSYYIDFQLEKVNNNLSYYRMGNNYNMVNNYNMNNNYNPDINLLECFKFSYNYLELSNGNNQRFCNACNNLSDHLSQNILCSLPENLIIYLNRGENDIYNCNVIFQEYLDLNSFVKDNSSNTMFELYGFICGINESSTEQHFIAYCKNQEDKRWYLYDGELVSSCEKPWENHKGMVYILFYKSFI